MEPIALWQKREGEKIRCLLCPRGCLLAPGGTGVCRVRRHEPGRGIIPLNYGLVSSVALDPVEKKTLYHWNPGTSILSMGTVGCTMDCPFCQNWAIACWEPNIALTRISPDDLPAMAAKFDVSSVAFTYNEPFAWYEFVLDGSRTLRKAGLLPVVVTNGQLNPGPLEEIAPLLAAANIDLKAFTPEAYQFMGGNLEAAKNTIKTLIERGVHSEVTFLLVPGINDDRSAFKTMIMWLASLDPVPVLHISRYFPNRRWTAPPTPQGMMDEFMAIAAENLPRVYPGNTGSNSDTKCLRCGSVLVSRNNRRSRVQGMDSRGACLSCGAPSDIVITRGLEGTE